MHRTVLGRAQCYGYYDDDDKGIWKEYDKASKYLDAEDAKAQLQKAADKAAKGCCSKPEDEKLAKAAGVAAQAAKDAADGTKIPETFKVTFRSMYMDARIRMICSTYWAAVAS